MEFRNGWSGRSHDYSQKAIDAVVEVMKHGDPQTQGKYLKQFEAAFSNYTKAVHCFGVTNCTHALELIADLTGLKPGDEVIIPGHTYCASAIPFGRSGATIKWADIDPETFEVSLDSIKSLCTNKTKLIVVVHLYGMMCDIGPIADFAKEKSIFLAEDCAQSLGAFKDGQSCGTFGDFGAFSFHAQKNITTMGEGGMLVVKDEKLASLVPGIRHNGHKPFSNQTDYWRPAMSNVDLDIEGMWPHNFSLSEAQAAVGAVLLGELNEMREARCKRSQLFIEQLSSFDELVFQKNIDPLSHSHHLLVARYDGEKTGKSNHNLIRILSNDFGIKVIVQYYPLYRYDLFQKMGFGDADCPLTDYFFDNMISFPFHIWMSDDDFEYMIESTKKALTQLRG
ncbi:MAG: DegT/DnrJ/EryC1/StrS family aminotransferase [Desulfamplus sp.]|nr:DegT/DnrJ/EryC1/StrS family aminotransferase [Desulfamplus sp.]